MVKIRIKSQSDLLAGLFFVMLAVAGLWVSRDYPIGTALEMGMGYVPRLLLWILLLLGAVVTIRGLTISAEAGGPWAWRPLLMIGAAFLFFGFGIERLGMVISSIALVMLGGYAGYDARFRELAIASILLAAGSAVIFSWAAGVPIPIWPRW